MLYSCSNNEDLWERSSTSVERSFTLLQASTISEPSSRSSVSESAWPQGLTFYSLKKSWNFWISNDASSAGSKGILVERSVINSWRQAQTSSLENFYNRFDWIMFKGLTSYSYLGLSFAYCFSLINSSSYFANLFLRMLISASYYLMFSLAVWTGCC